MKWSQADRFILAMISQNFKIEVIKIDTYKPEHYIIYVFTETDIQLCAAFFDKEGNCITI